MSGTKLFLGRRRATRHVLFCRGVTDWHHVSLAHLLLFEGLLLVLRCRFLLVSVLFGTTFQELLGKVLGLGSVPQVGPDIIVHLVRRVHFFQEGCKRWNWQGSRWRIFVSLASRNGQSIVVCGYLCKTYHPDCWLCWACAGFAHTTAWRCPAGSYWPLGTTLAASPPLLPSCWLARSQSYFMCTNKCRMRTKNKSQWDPCITHILDVVDQGRIFLYFGILKYLRLALPLLFFWVLLFLGWGGCWTASFTASSQKPILELWVSPQMLLGSEPQLEQVLGLTDPHTELLKDVCEKSERWYLHYTCF